MLWRPGPLRYQRVAKREKDVYAPSKVWRSEPPQGGAAPSCFRQLIDLATAEASIGATGSSEPMCWSIDEFNGSIQNVLERLRS
jgi:hypothetical protein